jgi:hypothetical protein
MSLNQETQKQIEKLTNQGNYHWNRTHFWTLNSCYNNLIIFISNFIRE